MVYMKLGIITITGIACYRMLRSLWLDICVKNHLFVLQSYDLQHFYVEKNTAVSVTL